VLDLYGRVVDGEELGSDDYVISADEKSQLQALRRCHRGLGTGPGRPRRVEFEYERSGTLGYMAASDVHAARLFGSVADKTAIVPFMTLVERVKNTEPYRSARRVFWIVDNGSSHNGRRSVDRMTAAWPNATLVHLPVHASWLNQIEVVFSVIQRKVIRPADLADLGELADRLERFEAATTPLPPRSTGGSPPLTSPVCGSGSTPTKPASPTVCSPPEPAQAGCHDGPVRPPPESTKHSLAWRLRQHARDHWPGLADVRVRFRSNFAYIDAGLPDGETIRLCRLRYTGSASTWGFAIYRASHDDYEDNVLPNGFTAGSPEDAFDCACTLYINEATRPPNTPTN
jgi:DDE superfamily endonuclease